MDQAMDQANGKDKKHFEIYWSTYAVLLAFCIKKAKNNIHNEIYDTQARQATQTRQHER